MVAKALILLAFLPLLAGAQPASKVGKLMPMSAPGEIAVAQNQIDHLIGQLKSRPSGGDYDLLRSVFRKTERTFLKRYIPYSNFQELFGTGSFDCLTATALFSIILDRLGFQYNIMETNHHIFLVVETTKGQVLLETTDRFDGFVSREREIKGRIESYRAPERLTASGSYRFHFELYDRVDPGQLPGLLQFNQAVKAYNRGNIQKCADYLVDASVCCNSPRIAELAALVIHSLGSSRLDRDSKRHVMEQLNPLASVPGFLASL